MREIISCRMSDRVLLCMCRLSITLLSKKKLLAGGRGRRDEGRNSLRILFNIVSNTKKIKEKYTFNYLY